MYETIRSALDEEIIPPHPDADLLKALSYDMKHERNLTLDELIYIGEHLAAFGSQLVRYAKSEKAKVSGKDIFESIMHHE